MIVGLVCYQDRLAALFDTAAHVQLLRLENGGVEELERLPLNRDDPAERARALAQNGLDLLLCGAISCHCQALLEQTGIKVRPFLCGGILSVVRALLDDRLDDLAMPGCGQGRRCPRGGHGAHGGHGRGPGCGRSGRNERIRNNTRSES